MTKEKTIYSQKKVALSKTERVLLKRKISTYPHLLKLKENIALDFSTVLNEALKRRELNWNKMEKKLFQLVLVEEE